MRAAILTLLVLAVGAAAWLFWPGDERRVRLRVLELAEAASVPDNESDLARVARLGALARGLAPDVTIAWTEGVPVVTGRDAVVALAAQAAHVAGSFELEVAGIDVTVDPPRQGAVAVLAVRVRGADRRASEEFDGQEIRLELRRNEEGEWVVTRVGRSAALLPPG